MVEQCIAQNSAVPIVTRMKEKILNSCGFSDRFGKTHYPQSEVRKIDQIPKILMMNVAVAVGLQLRG